MVIVKNECAGLEQTFISKNCKDFKERLKDIEHKIKIWNNIGGKAKQYDIVKIEKDNNIYYYDRKKYGVGMVFSIVFVNE